jgi:predicted DNA-binding transcriptional regulator YafY
MSKFETLPKKSNKSKPYDKTLFRLIDILRKLSNNERPTINELEKEYGVSKRTVQRDIYERLEYFAIEKNSLGELYFIDGFTLDKCTLDSDEMMFVYLSMSQVKDLSSIFETKIDHIFTKLLNPNFSSTYFMKQKSIEKINTKSKLYKDIESTIKNNYFAKLKAKNIEVEIKPYKIVSIDGIWYLLARDMDDGRVKTYIISDIMKYTNTYKSFILETNIDEVLSNVHSGWFEDGNTFEVVVKVSYKIAKYFKARKLLPTQEIINEEKDGSLLISYQVSHHEDIDNVIKSWLPDIQIISPKDYKVEFENELKEYISKMAVSK